MSRENRRIRARVCRQPAPDSDLCESQASGPGCCDSAWPSLNSAAEGAHLEWVSPLEERTLQGVPGWRIPERLGPARSLRNAGGILAAGRSGLGCPGTRDSARFRSYGRAVGGGEELSAGNVFQWMLRLRSFTRPDRQSPATDPAVVGGGAVPIGPARCISRQIAWRTCIFCANWQASQRGS